MKNIEHPPLLLWILCICIFLSTSLSNTSNVQEPFRYQKISYVFVWNWFQRFVSLRICKRKRISAFIINETVIQIENQHFWLWVATEPVHRTILSFISQTKETCL
ncbi:MAG TPA: hypothetical protein VJ697_09765 [Nitrososphaeraceae archaeon]|nr:hypothetical protein [Nitrososphaeraceae archaeon]